MVTAWPHDGIAPLEMWDVMVDGRSLFARREEPTFYASLAAATTALRRGDAVRETGERLPSVPWESLALVGGAVDEARARAALDPLEVVSADPFFAATAAVDALLLHCVRSTGAAPLVVDVGQTAIKAVGEAGKSHRPRGEAGSILTPEELVAEIAAALTEASGAASPSFVLLALPCEVDVRDGELLLGASTYPTASDGAVFARDVLALAGHPLVPAAVVNDAVLAAWALERTSPSRSRLVLTLGLGVGAAFRLP